MEAHPVGDDENRPQKAIPATVKAMVVDTRSGRIQVYPGIKNRQPPPLVSWYSLPSFRKSAVCFLLLDVEVTAGNTTASNHAQPGLNRVLDSLSAEQRPYLVRGDCGLGNDAVIREMETRQQPYLFKLRQTPIAASIYPPRLDERRTKLGRPQGQHSTCRVAAEPSGGYSPAFAEAKPDCHPGTAGPTGICFRGPAPDQSLRIRRAGDGSHRKYSGHRAAVPGPGGCGERF